MDDFIYVLITAGIFMIFVFILAGVGPWVSPGSYQTQVINFSVGKVGVVNDIPTRTDSFGSFVVGEEQSQQLKQVPQFLVGTSWLGGNVQEYQISVPEWYLEEMESARITFKVQETNKYGNLVIAWNGLVVSKKVADTGIHEVVVDKEYVKESNSVKIYAEGPGLMFWASTAYLIRDFNVDVTYGPKRLVPFQTLRSELESFSRGEVTFYASDNPGRLDIKVNGFDVYDDVPSGFGSAQFDFIDVPLNAGTNIVSFSSTGKVNLHDVNLNLFLLTNEIVRARRFNITDAQYQLLQQGYKPIVQFDVSNVVRQGNLEVRINDKITRMAGVQEGANSVTFDSDEVHLGENEIAFSGTGGYVIGDASVTIGL